MVGHDVSLKTSRDRRVEVKRSAHLKLYNKVVDLEEYIKMLEKRVSILEAGNSKNENLDILDESVEADPIGLAELRESIKDGKK